jgi:hypothetical protein
MSTPRIIRAAQTLFNQISRMARSFTKGLISWLLRSLLVLGRQPRWAKAGFVLPTTILLLLVVTLTVGAIGFRTFTRTQQTIGERQQRVIYNAATPALDRAKAKLEFLFDVNRDPRGGIVPKEDTLLHMMLNDGGSGVSAHSSGIDPYTFTDTNPALNETRLDINGGGIDNAWKYRADTNGDGTLDATVAYSIIFQAPANKEELKDTRDNVAGKGAVDRAAKLQIRNTPLSSTTQISSCRPTTGGATGVPQTNDEGWFKDPVNTTILRKNFQVDVYVLPDKVNGAVATIEFQQDRQANQGFKWAAWFRNDLEIFPGPTFNWNGAMHSEGSFFVNGPFKGYMISSIASCLYTQDASEITTSSSEGDAAQGIPAYQGQFVAGTVRDNSFGGSPSFDLWNGSNVMPVRDSAMTPGKDSVLERNGLKPADFALDPVKLHTDDISVSRKPSIANPASERDPNWKNGDLNKKKRMYNLAQDTPYVDDTFRADNRWGPKPRWGPKRERIPALSMGTPIVGNAALTGDDPPPGGDSTNIGLDGYWERRARREGLRLIVGQRLELGDPAGWGGPGATPLNPAYGIDPLDDAFGVSKEPLRPWAGCGSSNTPRCNEARQRKTLWDNLASVQATAVYHAVGDTGGNLDFPLACIATTVHPGTAGTLDKSGTFENLAYGLPSNAIAGYTNATQPLIISDFFRGRGTNGWEYKVPPLTDFTNSTSPLRTALRNLAQFAGDPRGGTPSFPPPPETSPTTTPYPLMSMWGDFSMLRRVINRMEGSGISYDALSPADKTTLHTAGCTLGMLAYNIDYLEKLPKVNGLPGEDTLTARLGGSASLAALDLLGQPNLALTSLNGKKGLRGYIRLIDAATNDAIPNNDPSIATFTAAVPEIGRLPTSYMQKMATDAGASNNPETYVRIMERWRDRLAVADPERDKLTKAIYLAQLLITREQVARDRTYGFRGTYGSLDSDAFPSTAPLGECAAWKAALPAQDELYRLCSSRPRYPILYSLFPARLTSIPPLTATIDTWYSSLVGFQNHGDIKADRLLNQHFNVRDQIDGDDSYLRFTANASVDYKVVKPELVATLPRGAQGMGSSEAWKLPAVAATDGTTPNNNSQNLIKVCATSPCSLPSSIAGRAPAMSAPRYRVPFKDASLYSGRELMSVRTLDLDLDLMRTSATPAGDFWLPKSGIVYAFREDAVSEAHIARPKKGNWATCASDAALQAGSLQNDDNCRMRTSDSYDINYDPPLSPLGITPKPVDFFADPDRRPYGFRLRNGVTVRRTGDNGIGLSFITDNPAYVQGPFNLHQTFGATETAGGDGLEEFITPAQRLNTTDFSNFYTRDTLDNTQFSIPTADQWRPSEVLADAVTPLSTNFCDGSMEDSFMTAGNGSYVNVSQRYGCSGSSETSYGNQPRLTGTVVASNGVRWMRSNVVDSLWSAFDTGTNKAIEGESPIFIHPHGNPMTITAPGEYKGAYDTIDAGRALISGVDGTQMNMIMISGIVPSRAGQAYGGLHNFPRFLENWSGKKLFLSGAFLQLNFSTYATAPFDQENWQPGDPVPSTSSESIRYYSPPTRIWGYDVGLQYAPAGPVARRFKASLPARSEFYSEPAANDPYIKNLCLSISTPANCS